MTIETGKVVEIDQGFGMFTEGIVKSYDGKTKNMMGHVGNYMIEITGGVDCFSKPAKVGDTIKVLKSNVREMPKRYYIEIDGTDYMVEGFDIEDGNCQLLRTCNLSEAISYKTKEAAGRYLAICGRRCRSLTFTIIEI